MIVQSSGLISVGVIKTRVENNRKSMRLLAIVEFWPLMVLWYYHGTLIWASMIDDEDSDRIYGEKLLSVKIKEFHICSVFNINYVMDRNRRNEPVWVGLVKFSQLHFITGPRILEGDTSPWIWQGIWKEVIQILKFCITLFPERCVTWNVGMWYGVCLNSAKYLESKGILWRKWVFVLPRSPTPTGTTWYLRK